jgi:tripartite-type tricarboxylate transporter receptor subunit TctC
MFRRLISGAAVVALATAVLATGPAQAQSAEDFFKGKTLKIIFGFGVGGTYGKYSLMLAEFLSRHIPGNPKVVTQSMPGAGGLRAANYAYNAMPKDGTALYMPVDSLVISQLLRPNKVKFKSNLFTWLGTVIQSNATIVVRADAGINSLSDLKSKQVIMASSGKGSQTFLMPQLLNALYGAKFKIVMGYRGSRKMQLSMEQGETQGVSLTWLAWKSGKPDWFKPGGFAKTVVQIGVEKEADLGHVPMFSDVVQSAEDKQIVAFMASLSPIGRGLALPPGVRSDRVAALKAAFARTVSDPDFLAAAAKRNLRVNGLTGDQVQTIVDNALNISPAVVKRAQKLIMGAK